MPSAETSISRGRQLRSAHWSVAVPLSSTLARSLTRMSPMRLAIAAVLGIAFAFGCGREPLDLGPDAGSSGSAGSGIAGSGSAGSVGGAGASGSGGGATSTVRVPANHRATASTCPTFPPPTVTTCPTPFGEPIECMTNADCTKGVDARCAGSAPFGGCTCSYDGCFSDADCAADRVCACSGTYSGNTCVSGGCHVDADCGAGGYCVPVADPCTGVIEKYACHKPGDACIVDTDCPSGEMCALDLSWYCSPPIACPL